MTKTHGTGNVGQFVSELTTHEAAYRLMDPMISLATLVLSVY